MSTGTPTPEAVDLLWAVNSPPLLAAGLEVPQLDSVDAEQLRVFLDDGPSTKVGEYFESLIQFWLERIRGCELIAHRRQVMDGKVTLGELDFVFHDEEGRLNHWETAVKFYLCDPENEVNGSCFIGPNTADTLERKIDRLRRHQLPLSRRDFPEVQERRAFVKGRIYRNPTHRSVSVIPRDTSPDHLRGVWLRHKQLEWLDAVEAQGRCEYRVLAKPYWLCSAPAESLNVNNLLRGLRRHFEDAKQSIHVGIWREGVETERLFVVADQWPHL